MVCRRDCTFGVASVYNTVNSGYLILDKNTLPCGNTQNACTTLPASSRGCTRHLQRKRMAGGSSAARTDRQRNCCRQVSAREFWRGLRPMFAYLHIANIAFA